MEKTSLIEIENEFCGLNDRLSILSDKLIDMTIDLYESIAVIDEILEIITRIKYSKI